MIKALSISKAEGGGGEMGGNRHLSLCDKLKEHCYPFWDEDNRGGVVWGVGGGWGAVVSHILQIMSQANVVVFLPVK